MSSLYCVTGGLVAYSGGGGGSIRYDRITHQGNEALNEMLPRHNQVKKLMFWLEKIIRMCQFTHSLPFNSVKSSHSTNSC